uniref:Uncharacterized protein n=1 Tax=Aureoumbra lagunensis TaxID=44058 RepID=A0A7S3JVV0_9STRA|mmetsp:Transcript_5071/g.7592  ORF Transcript_5071/g.7592 Transcript_5071/m.7592 type:complete len:432 (-) Transcript_5071:128-1423(-)
MKFFLWLILSLLTKDIVSEGFTAYPKVTEMKSPFGPIRLEDLDKKESGWAFRYKRLVIQRIQTIFNQNTSDVNNKDSFQKNERRRVVKKKFEKLYCMGNQKSSTTTFAHAASWLGYRETVGSTYMARQINYPSYARNFYQDGYIPENQRKKLEHVFQKGNLFEDDPYFVLYRLANNFFLSRQMHVGYVLTIRNCKSLAESSAAFNNPASGVGGNSDIWNHDHCLRHYRRCHVHLLDVFLFLKERTQSLQDFLFLDMDSAKLDGGKQLFLDLVDFAFLGSSATIYSSSSLAQDIRNEHIARLPIDLLNAREHILQQHQALPHSNSRSKRSKERTFCPSDLLNKEAQRFLSGSIIANLSAAPPNHGQCRKQPTLKGCKEMQHQISSARTQGRPAPQRKRTTPTVPAHRRRGNNQRQPSYPSRVASSATANPLL